MPGRYPTVNETLGAIRNAMNHGARGPSEGPQNMGMESRRALAGGGKTAGLAANPARGGNPSPHGIGPSLVPNGMPTQASATHSARSMAQIPGLVRAGHMDATQGQQLMRQHQVHLDNYAKQKRAAAIQSSKPKVRGPSFGSISDGRDDVNQTSLLTDGRRSDVPGASAIGTTRSPFNQGGQSGGSSAVPNSSFNPGGRRGPGGYDF
jgi:hypothetical protein